MRVLALALLAACTTTVDAVDGEHRMQRTRAGYSANGSFVSSHLLLRDDAGQPLACSDGTLTVQMSVSTTGADGEFDVVDQDVIVRCPEGPGGDLAVVLDNSGSTASVVSTLRGASALLVDEVIDAGGRASLTRVSTEASVLQPLTADSGELGNAIVNGIRDDSNGWTALYDGVRMGNETFGGAVVHREGSVEWPDLDSFCGSSDRLGIVAFTDGHENNSADQQEYDHDRYPGDSYDTTMEDLQSLHVAGQTTPIYTVGLGDEPDHAELEAIANATGGTHTRLDDVSQIGPLFETLGDYFGSTYQVCGELPETACGTSHVKLTWSLQDDTGASIASGETLQAVTLDCPVEQPEGRSATVLLTMTNPELPAADVATFADNTVRWVAADDAPSILVVLDDSHHGEFSGDADAIRDMLVASGHQVDRLDEPTHGLSPADLEGYDVVWFSNPGYPPDDLASIQALAAFNADGGGLVLQGDDITWTAGNAFSMDALTGLSHIDNGVRACGVHINNANHENYEIDMQSDHPMFSGLASSSWLYSDDIDNSSPAGVGETILAQAGVEIDPTCALRPVVTVIDPAP